MNIIVKYSKARMKRGRLNKIHMERLKHSGELIKLTKRPNEPSSRDLSSRDVRTFVIAQPRKKIAAKSKELRVNLM